MSRNNNDNEKIATLLSMGFNKSDAERALNIHGGNVEQSINYLLSSSPDQQTASPPGSERALLPVYHHQQQHMNNNNIQQQQQQQQNQEVVVKKRYVTFTKQDQSGSVICYWILNILWLILGGWHMFLAWFSTGIILCLTIICMPCGWQIIKISIFLLFPFGLSLVDSDDQIIDDGLRCCCKCFNCLFNTMWAITVGWILALQQIITGIILCLTIIGIPFGIQCFKMSYLCFRPFGLDISTENLTEFSKTTKKNVVTTTRTTRTIPTCNNDGNNNNYIRTNYQEMSSASSTIRPVIC